MSKYVITDGKRWIMKDKKGRYVPTTCGSFALELSKRQADTIFTNQLSKALKSCFHVEIINERSEESQDTDHTKKLTKKVLSENMEHVMDQPEIQKWMRKVKEFNGLISEIEVRKKELSEQMSTINKKMTDINHYIEFSKLNAAEGYVTYRKQKLVLQKRRTIKNELYVLGIIADCIANNTYGDIEKRVKGLDNRTYEPRELDELFDL